MVGECHVDRRLQHVRHARPGCRQGLRKVRHGLPRLRADVAGVGDLARGIQRAGACGEHQRGGAGNGGVGVRYAGIEPGRTNQARSHQARLPWRAIGEQAADETRPVPGGEARHAMIGRSERNAVKYAVVAEAYRDLEQASGRLALIERLATLLAEAPAGLLPTVCYLCQGLIAPEFAGVDLGLAEKLAVRTVATATGTGAEQVAARVRETGDLGQAAEQLLATTAADRLPSLPVTAVVDTLHQIAGADGPGSQGRKLDLLAGLLGRATPLEARYLLRLVTGGLRLGIGTPTILDALAQVYAGGRAARPVLERAYNICCDLGQVAAAVASGGVAEVERIRVRPGNPVRVMLAQRLSDADEILAKLGGRCAAEHKYDGMRVQAHRTADGTIELFTRRLERVASQFPDVVELLAAGLGPREAILEGEVVAFDPAAGELRPFGEVMLRRRGVYGALLLAAYDPAADIFRTVTKCGTGFTDADLAALPARLAPLARPARPARVEARQQPDVWFEPGLVLEILSAELTLSPNYTAAWGQIKDQAGLAMRFPRFTGRWRDDKGPQDATTTGELADLYRTARRRPAAT